MKKNSLLENFKTLFYAIVAALIIRSFLFEPFSIPSGSMYPTLFVGDYLFVSKYTYGFSRHSLPLSFPIIPKRIFYKEPKRGDVIVFKTPEDNKTDYIKRLIGLPGDKIQFIDGELYINNNQVLKSKIPIKNKSMISILEENRAAEQAKLNKEKTPIRSMRKIMTTERKAQMIMEPLKTKLKLAEVERDNEFKKRKELVLMRLPHLKTALERTKNDAEITLLVQTEIIRSIYEPDPSEENCPGEFLNGDCIPNTKWTNKVWKLYRRLYKFKDIASHIFPDRRSIHRQKLSKSKKFGGAELW